MATATTQVVEHGGLRFVVPAGWPVHDLAVEPTTCVRADAHAAFLGEPGDVPDCPARVVGHTETLRIAPLRDPHQLDAARATTATTINGLPARVDPDPEVNGALTAVFTDRALLVVVTFGADRATADAILASATATGPPTAPAGPGPGAGAAGSLGAGASGLYRGLGFDTCFAPSASQMNAWLASPYRAIGIYIGGSNRGCANQTNLTPSWVTTVQGQGWSLLPLYVGSQAPATCNGGVYDRISTNLTTAASQGASEAHDAADQAAALGIVGKAPIFFDLEAYTRGSVCSPPVKAFIHAWTTTLHARGYVSGFYSSSASGIADQAQFAADAAYAEPDAIWFANWNNNPALFGDPFFTDALWTCHQRHHQFQAPHDETHGGVTLNIDSDNSDGPAVGAPPRKMPWCWPTADSRR